MHLVSLYSWGLLTGLCESYFLFLICSGLVVIGWRAAGTDSWAYFHLPNTKPALGPPCSSLIIHIQARASWQVCWSHSMFCDSDNTFSLRGQKRWGHHTSWGQCCETERRQKLWMICPLWQLLESRHKHSGIKWGSVRYCKKKKNSKKQQRSLD